MNMILGGVKVESRVRDVWAGNYMYDGYHWHRARVHCVHLHKLSVFTFTSQILGISPGAVLE